MQSLVMLFENSVQAMDADDACEKLHYPASLIPLPESIKAGCGLGLLLKNHSEEWWQHEFEKEKLHYQSIWKGDLF
jgi:hypothetical protein